jgi:hypothetical protein
LDLITRVVTGEPFLDIELPSFAAPSLVKSSSSEAAKEHTWCHDHPVFPAVSFVVVAVVCFLAGMFVDCFATSMTINELKMYNYTTGDRISGVACWS